jgi:hypothetical protein
MTTGGKVALGVGLVGVLALMIFTLDTSQPPTQAPAPSIPDRKAPIAAAPKESWDAALSDACTEDLAKAGFSVECKMSDDSAVVESPQMNRAMASRIMDASWPGAGDPGDKFVDMWKDGGITTVTFTNGSGFSEAHAIQ